VKTSAAAIAAVAPGETRGSGMDLAKVELANSANSYF
jgi:hypothetical protein